MEDMFTTTQSVIESLRLDLEHLAPHLDDFKLSYDDKSDVSKEELFILLQSLINSSEYFQIPKKNISTQHFNEFQISDNPELDTQSSLINDSFLKNYLFNFISTVLDPEDNGYTFKTQNSFNKLIESYNIKVIFNDSGFKSINIEKVRFPNSSEEKLSVIFEKLLKNILDQTNPSDKINGPIQIVSNIQGSSLEINEFYDIVKDSIDILKDNSDNNLELDKDRADEEDENEEEIKRARELFAQIKLLIDAGNYEAAKDLLKNLPDGLEAQKDLIRNLIPRIEESDKRKVKRANTHDATEENYKNKNHFPSPDSFMKP